MNMSYIKEKVDGNIFHINTNIIVVYLGLPEECDTSYFDNAPTPSFLEFYLLEEEMIGTILKEGVKFKNLMKKDLARLAFIFLQIMVSNILPQVGHLYEIENFGLEHHHLPKD